MKRLDIRDADIVSEIIADESVFATAKDDSVTDPYAFVRGALKNEHNIWLMPEENSLIMFRLMNGIMAEMHIAVKKESRNKTRIACIKACDWLFNNSEIKKVISMIRSTHLASVSLAFECGMKQEGLISEGMQVDGELVDLIVLGATKRDFNKLYERDLNKLYGGASCHQ